MANASQFTAQRLGRTKDLQDDGFQKFNILLKSKYNDSSLAQHLIPLENLSSHVM